MTANSRFNEKWVPVTESGCWLWLGATDHIKMTGSFYLDGEVMRAYRASWILHKGPVSDGICVCHKCDTPLCVNPDHLFLGTHQDNMRDRDAKGRGQRVKGEDKVCSKLKDDDVLAMMASDKRMHELAKDYGVSLANVSSIMRGKLWTHIVTPEMLERRRVLKYPPIPKPGLRKHSDTHCKNGHLWTEKTLYLMGGKNKVCRECHRVSEAARRRSLKERDDGRVP